MIYKFNRNMGLQRIIWNLSNKMACLKVHSFDIIITYALGPMPCSHSALVLK